MAKTATKPSNSKNVKAVSKPSKPVLKSVKAVSGKTEKTTPAKASTAKSKIADVKKKTSSGGIAVVRSAVPVVELKSQPAPKVQPKLSVITNNRIQQHAMKSARQAVLAKQNKNQPDVFGVGSYVVYPTHGVGRITDLESQEIAGHQLKLYVIAFEKDKMVLRVPLSRAKATGLRSLSSKTELEGAVQTLKQKAKIAKGMWSKRAQEYESKINSGNITFLAEVVRDLHRNVDHPERSYSERVIYENAFGRLVKEFAVVEALDAEKAAEKIIKVLTKKAA